MWLRWFGHSSFLITSDAGLRIVTDPYQTKSGFNYGRVLEKTDIVTISHEHADHNYTGDIPGSPTIVRETGVTEVQGIRFNGIASYHDNQTGKSRGNNTIFCFKVDDMAVCHLGDLGHILNDDQLNEIGTVDVLLMPVGGYYTIDAKEATIVSSQIKPSVIIPMHYKTPKLDYPIAKVDAFLEGKPSILRMAISEIQLSHETIGSFAGIVVLGSAL